MPDIVNILNQIVAYMDEENKNRFVVLIIQLRELRRVTLTKDSSDSENESEQDFTKQTQEGKATKCSDEDDVAGDENSKNPSASASDNDLERYMSLLKNDNIDDKQNRHSK